MGGGDEPTPDIISALSKASLRARLPWGERRCFVLYKAWACVSTPPNWASLFVCRRESKLNWGGVNIKLLAACESSEALIGFILAPALDR